MKKILVALVIVMTLVCCSSAKRVSGSKFIYKSLNRELVLSFDNDSLCSLTNTFHCDDIDNKYKEIVVKAFYERRQDIIILKNVSCVKEDCKYSSNIDIPIQQSIKCSFLDSDGRTKKEVFDGRTYQSDYYKFGLVPNIDIDTLYIHNNEVTLIKKIDRGNFGFVFKKVN